MSSMGSQRDKSKTASSETVTRLFQKSLRDLITGACYDILYFLSRVVVKFNPRCTIQSCTIYNRDLSFPMNTDALSLSRSLSFIHSLIY